LGPLDFELERGTSTLFAEATGFLSRTLTLTGGIRIDFPDDFKRRVSPRAGIGLRPLPDTRLHASYGRGFKLPSFYALGEPFIGNPGLTPETSSGWDVGIQQGFWDRRIVADIAYFSNVFHGLIDFDPAVFGLVNRNEVRMEGVELEATFSLSSGITIRINGTYLNADIVGSSEELRNRPKFSGGIAGSWSPRPVFVLDAELIAAGRRFDFQVPTTQDSVDGFAKINLVLTAVPAENWRLYVRVENMLDADYEEFIGFPAPGVHAKAGVAYFF
jgi:outer membrane cobalamin receptor